MLGLNLEIIVGTPPHKPNPSSAQLKKKKRQVNHQ